MSNIKCNDFEWEEWEELCFLTWTISQGSISSMCIPEKIVIGILIWPVSPCPEIRPKQRTTTPSHWTWMWGHPKETNLWHSRLLQCRMLRLHSQLLSSYPDRVNPNFSKRCAPGQKGFQTIWRNGLHWWLERQFVYWQWFIQENVYFGSLVICA